MYVPISYERKKMVYLNSVVVVGWVERYQRFAVLKELFPFCKAKGFMKAR